MNIGIIGYGRMGREIESQSQQRNHTIAFTIDPHNTHASHKSLHDINHSIWENTDIIIEFSLADAVKKNALLYAPKKIPTIIGTTGWEADQQEVKKIIEEHNTSCMYGANFSLGAHMFTHVAHYMAQCLNTLPHYDVGIFERHHNQKKDHPSSTAIMTAERMLSALTHKTEITHTLQHNTPIQAHQINICSQRVGCERGLHEVVADSDCDTLTLSHTARNRTGFSLGAIMAAEWLLREKAHHTGLINVKTFINSIFNI